MEAASQPPARPEEDRSVSMERANVVALLAIPALAMLLFIPFVLLHGIKPFMAGWLAISSPLVWAPALIITVVVHEALHGLGFLLGGGERAHVKFGFQLKTLTPFAAYCAPLRARGYRLACALPGVVLGLLPAVIGMASGTGWLVVTAFWMLAFAGGDILILWLIRDLDGDVLVIDHPERAGCRVVHG